MNKEEKIEEFLGKLPKETVVKIKKLKFYKNLVLIRQRKNFLEEVETGELIKKSDWDFTLPELAQKLHVTRSWLYNNLRGDVRYIYINTFNLESLSIFYQKPMTELNKYRELAIFKRKSKRSSSK